MNTTQPGILATETALARYLSFTITSSAEIKAVLATLNGIIDTEQTVVGIGQSLVSALDKTIPGLKTFPAASAAGIDIPSTPAALWCWLRGSDRGELYHRSRQIESLLLPAFALEEAVDAFQYADCRDLSGYVDGTENPKGDEAIAAACVADQGQALDGSSFVAVQQWVHDFEVQEEMSTSEMDNTIGRRISDNEEIDDAPASAHVKRTAQESFTPEAFILRRSMPWAEEMHAGLMFVAFGHSFSAYEALLNRMTGAEDGISDALFTISHPVSGAYYWCPPVKDGKLNFAALGV